MPVFAPATGRQCHELAQAAFHWSERLRTPVVILSDKEVGMTSESVDVSSLRQWPHTAREPFTGSPAQFLPYACECLEEPSAFAPLGSTARVVATGSVHDRAGRLQKNVPEAIELLSHLQAKIAAHAEEMTIVEAELVANAGTLVLSYGISARAARTACRRMNREGRRVSFLQLLTLFPVPTEAIRQAAQGCSRVAVVEENSRGLYASVLEPVVGTERLVRVNGLGRMITPVEIIQIAGAA